MHPAIQKLQLAAISGSTKISRLLIKHRAYVDAIGGRFFTTLGAAVAYNKADAVQELLDAGAEFTNPRYTRGDRQTASLLCIASTIGHIDIVPFLLEKVQELSKPDLQSHACTSTRCRK